MSAWSLINQPPSSIELEHFQSSMAKPATSQHAVFVQSLSSVAWQGFVFNVHGHIPVQRGFGQRVPGGDIINVSPQRVLLRRELKDAARRIFLLNEFDRTNTAPKAAALQSLRTGVRLSSVGSSTKALGMPCPLVWCEAAAEEPGVVAIEKPRPALSTPCLKLEASLLDQCSTLTAWRA